MDENQSSLEKKPYSFKTPFAWGFGTCLVMFLILCGIYAYHQHKVRLQEAQERQKYEMEHAGVVRDSLAQVAILQARYRQMRFEINKFDSARATLRYRIGDIVFLKPDSVRGVITDVTADSALCCYSYFVLINNKEGITTICEKKEKLIY